MAKKLVGKLRNIYAIASAEHIIRWVIPQKIFGDERITKRKFKKEFGYELDLDSPKTLNEKMMWLKLHDHRDFCTMCADKYRVREYIKDTFGDQYLVPLLYMTEKISDIVPENMPAAPCVVKSNTGSGGVELVHRWDNVNFGKLRTDIKKWLYLNRYYCTQEWQYKDIKPCIIIEEMLRTKEGKIPGDYKLHYLNGRLAFIYCCYDREGDTKRGMYDEKWNRLPFQWISNVNYKTGLKEGAIPKPESLSEMIRMGDEVAKNFKYVRVDFYDVDGKPYFGEITLYHGAGFNHFHPNEYDLKYGEMLRIYDV